MLDSDLKIALSLDTDKILTPIFTARKRSLGQGNMLTGVCLSTGGCLVPRGAWSWGRLVPGEGCLVPGGACLVGGVWSGGVPGGDPLGRLLLRAVGILLECILVVS